MILITTAGKVGTAAALALTEAGTPVRVLARHPEQHPRLAAAGVEMLPVDLEDALGVRDALEGIDSVVLVSLAVAQQELNVIEQAKDAGVGFIVKASSKASSDSPIERRRGQSVIEAGLAASDIAHSILRSNAYMDNFLQLAPAIARTDAFASSVGDGRVGLVDARDVGAAAAIIAAAPNEHAGRTYWLSGPAVLSYVEVAAILSDVLSRPITYTPRTRAEDERAMIDAGVPAAIAAQNAQAFSLTAEGDAEWLSDDLHRILGRAPRSFRDFAVDNRDAFRLTPARR